MKAVLYLAAVAFLVVMACGCPKGETGAGQRGDGSTTMSGKQPGVASSSGEPGSDLPDSDTALNDEPLSSVFQFRDYKLGMYADEIRLRYAADDSYQLAERWTPDNTAGNLSAVYSGESHYPTESTWFLGQQVAGIEVIDDLTYDKHLGAIEALDNEYGPAETAPPSWALDTRFFDGYDFEREGLETCFWGDEKNNTVMVAEYNEVNRLSSVMIIHLTHYTNVVDEVLSHEFNPPEAIPEPGEGLMPGVSLKEQKIGMPYEEVSRYFLGNDTRVVTADWVEEGRTGKLESTPADGRTLPGETVWFLEGVLVGYVRVTPDDTEEFLKTMVELDTIFAPSTQEPPEWARTTEFFSDYSGPVPDAETLYWCDEFARVALVAKHDFKEQTFSFTMVHLEQYPTALIILEEMRR